MLKLYKISTKPKQQAYFKRTTKPIYHIAESKEECEKWARNTFKDGVEISKIIFLGEQKSNHTYSPPS